MGLFDTGAMVAGLVDLVKSPRVQYLTDQLRHQLGQASGPISLGNSHSSGGNNGTSGARVSGAVNDRLNSVLGGLQKRPGASMDPGAQKNPMTDLWEQLLGQLQSPVSMPTGIDTANLMQQVKDAINPIFDAREATARAQTDRATQATQSMYGQLANEYTKQAPQQIAQAQAAQQQIEDLYGSLRSNIQGDFSRVSKEQGDLFAQLGIEDALPSVLEDQTAPVTDALTAASENQAQQQQRYMDIGQTDATYYREGAPLAKMQGNEISQDYLAQLTDYIQQSEAERSAGIQSGYMDQLSQAQNQLAQQQQSAQSEMGRRQGMLWDMLQAQMTASQQKPAALNVDTFMQQLPANMQQSVAGAFTKLQRSPEAVYGKVEDKRSPVPGTFVETTPEWYMSQADQMLQRGEIDPVTHQALEMYLQLYYNSGAR